MDEETNKERLIRLLNSVDNLTLRVTAFSGVMQGATQAINELIASHQRANELLEGVQEALSGMRAAEALVQPEAKIASRREPEQAKSPSALQSLR